MITEHLRPVLEDVLAKVRKATEAAGDVPWEMPRLLARAPKTVRDAFATVEEAVDRYSILRRAQFALRLVTGDVEDDAWSRMHEIQNLPPLWPQNAPGARQPPAVADQRPRGWCG